MNLNQFVGREQLAAMRETCRGEEGQYFRDMIIDLKKKIAAMPGPYESEGKGDDAMIALHYFRGDSDWYIMERDPLDGPQLQNFGFVCLHNDSIYAEFGYSSIEELIKYGVELDLYYTPQTVREIKIKYGKPLLDEEKAA